MSKESFHQFNVAVAKQYGIDAAVFLSNLKFWVERNAANKKNQRDGRTWTYNSIKAFTKLFPYWTTRQLDRIITKLTESGVIISGVYNENAHDRTKWYAFKNEADWLGEEFSQDVDKPILPNGEKQNTKPGAVILPNGEITEQIPTTSTLIEDEVVAYWNVAAETAGLKRCLAMNPKRTKSLRARLSEPFFRANWRAAIDRVGESAFHRGRNDRKWVADIEWFLRPGSAVKMMESAQEPPARNYDHLKTPPPEEPQEEAA